MNDPSAPLPSWAPRQAHLLLDLIAGILPEVMEGTPADRALQNRLSGQKQFGSRDRRLMGDALFARMRWHGAVDDLTPHTALCAAWMLDAAPWPTPLLALLRDLGVDAPPPLASNSSLDERYRAVEKTLGVALPPPDALLPAWWKDESSIWGPWSDRLHEAIHRPPTWLRVDRDRQPELHASLLEDGALWSESSPCSYGFTDSGKVHTWMRQHADCLEIQDISSQQVVRIANPQSGEIWWDACCGAGGKSLQLLDHAGRRLDLTCTDRREIVLRELIERGRRHGLGKVRRYVLDLLHEPDLPNLPFDGILLDAPCSGTGTWARNPDAPLRTSLSDIRQSARRQLQMLRAVLPVLRPGGQLVYAVCSLAQSETRDVVSALLDAEPTLQLQPFASPLGGQTTNGTLALLPKDTRGDGMFVATFVKAPR
jgi:16S rRNA (cytosine967-C5)-methyltransferase